ncbi:hypothetical protein LPB73_07595 [Tardiphaga sp. 37S4]|uniref:hypothetical protein n=1 Tax=Tardiphaga sp. 37S4 TaxID=1404741 RepID=UPI001E524E12|nr:hypothetical protein [Tardiphaga sp. 37S4]UFS77231.1 hypothetical protein LPB73_07595 [Tardiphaga sp. 37S4]
MDEDRRGSSAGNATLLLAMSLIMFGAKAIVIANYGSSVPYWDQWDGEAALLYGPYLDGNLTSAAMFASHNEHRILWTRIADLGILNIAGQWDPILQMLVNAMIHIGASVLLVALLLRPITPFRDRLVLVTISAIAFSLPVGWENLLAGFQSQFYFLLLFSTIAFWLLTRDRALSPYWFAGIAALGACYFSVASGTLLFFVAAALALFQMIKGDRLDAKGWAAFFILIVLGILCLTYVNRPPYHDQLKAKNFMEFAEPLVTLLGFPFLSITRLNFELKVLLLPIATAPACLLAFKFLTTRKRPTQYEWFAALALAAIVAQAISVAYSRSQGFLSPRYLDILLPAIPIGFATLCFFERGRYLRLLWAVMATACLVIFAVRSTAPQIDQRKTQTDAQMTNLKAFLATSNIQSLQDKPYLHVPYPTPERLAQILAMPKIRAILPEELRPSDASTAALRTSMFPHTVVYSLVKALKELTLRFGAVFLSLGIGLLLLCTVRLAGSSRPTFSVGDTSERPAS